MLFKTPTDFCDISRNCASVKFAAPGTSRSITNFGMELPVVRAYASTHLKGLQGQTGQTGQTDGLAEVALGSVTDNGNKNK